jgi:hypothetical protein
MALTDRTIQTKGKPAERPFKLFDAHGLFLLVKPNGGKYWRLQYRVGGKQNLLALGVYPEVTLKQAREKQADARRLIANGVDPMQVKREKKRQARAQSGDSFEAMAREWHEQQKGHWTASHAYCVLRSLQSEVFPKLGARPIQEITAPEIVSVLRFIEKRDALDTASRVLQRTKAIYRYAVSHRASRVPN